MTRTIFSCHHPTQHRWLSTCGWVEGCRGCRATRRTAAHGEPAGFWPSERRLEYRQDGECRSYDPAGRLMSVRPLGQSVTPL